MHNSQPPQPFTPNQLSAADAIDELKIGEGVEFVNGVYVERESPTRFVIDGHVMGFIETCQIAMREL